MSEESSAGATAGEAAPYSSPLAFDPPPTTSWGKLLALLPQGSRVLDVGCAFGNFSSAMRRLRGCHVVGVEIDAAAAEVARKHCDEVFVGDIAAVAASLPADFDVIVAADVLEHLLEPKAALEQLGKLLRPGGALLASIPNITHLSIVVSLLEGRFPRSREGLLDSTHVAFFGEGDVLDLFHQAGFAVRVVDRVRIDPQLTEFRSDLASMPEEVLAYLNRNPNADTYQFIVRAVPRKWAAEGDDQPAPASLKAPSATPSIRAQLDDLHQKLGKYHEALSAANAQSAELHRKIPALQQELDRAGDALEVRGGKLWARHASKQGPLPEGQLRVLFVADRDDAPFRYRCLEACQQLRASKVVANVARIDAPSLLASLAQYSMVILFRLRWSPPVQAVVEAARASGASVGFDIDDLLFDPAVEPLMPFLRRMPVQEVDAYRATMLSLAETIRQVDFCLAATPAIARHARALGKRALVHPNLVPHEYARLSRVLFPMRRKLLLRKPLIGYLSGSNTHDGDLESVAPALADVLAARTDARFAICGHARVPAALRRFQERVLQLPYQDYRVYPMLLAQCSAVIAPFQQLNDFTEAKSALKVFEAGIFGTPAVASPATQYREAIAPGESGYLASTREEWRDALLRLCERGASIAVGAEARRIALAEYSPQAFEHALARQLVSVAGAPSRKEALALQELGHTDLDAALRLARRSLLLALDPARRPDAEAGAVESLPAAEEEAAAAAVWVSVARRRGRELLIGDRAIGTVLADRQDPIATWRQNAVRAVPDASGGCAFESLGPDPSLRLEPAPQLARPPRALLLELRARCVDSARATAQLFWKPVDGDYTEGRSVVFPVVADGRRHVYLVDLFGALPASVEGIRLDPLDRAGEFEVGQLALLDGALPEGLPDVRRELAARFLSGDGLEIGALQNPLPLPPQARVRYVDRLPLAELRRQYPELEGQDLVDPSILSSGDDLGSVAPGSVRFVVTNHVLEHMRNPLAALGEWLRVLEPGGRLYVSIPGRENPHDRSRPVTTIAHLLEDDRGGGRKGSDIDRRAYHEWVDGVHGQTMPAPDRRKFAEKLIEQDYSIHFHVFDRALFETVVGIACERGGARLIELVEAPFDAYPEYIAILEKRQVEARRGVDVVVPVYNARELTRRCVESVLRFASGDVRVVLADDASPDRGIAEDLRAFAARDPRVVLLPNEKNLGFVGTANKAMRHAAGRDVLLLNSDTEVFEGFLEGLRSAAYADEATGIVTPFSNNATIFSLPEFGANEIPAGHTPESMARLVRLLSRRQRPQMPTAVGFCMYLRAEVLERVGYFDEETFGRGFGEEDDLCQRAKKAGFKVRLCDDVFVWHKGKASFGSEGHELESRNGPLLRQKHPEYELDVARFFRANPLAPAQREMRFHLARLRQGATGAALFILHASPFGESPGGTEHHVRDLLQALALPRAVLGYPEGGSLIAAEILDGNTAAPAFFRFPLQAPPERFAVQQAEVAETVRHWVDLFGIRWAHLHHLMFWPVSLGATLRDAGVPYSATLHDYYAVCPSWNLYDYAKSERCPCPHPETGEGCVRAFFEFTRFPQPQGMSIGELRVAHRAAWLETLRGARAIVTPSAAARGIVTSHLELGAVPMRVIEHGYDAAPITAAPRPAGPALRVAVLGEIAYAIKGSAQYRQLFDATRELPIEWHVFGNVEVNGYRETLDALALGDRLRLHGRYDRTAILDRLVAEGIELCLFLPEVDETFSFTLSEALLAGIPSLVVDRGALPDRVRGAGAGLVVSSAGEALAELRRICGDRTALEPLRQRARLYRHQSVAGNAAEYRQLYATIGFALALEAEPRPELLRELSARAGLLTEAAPPPPPPAPPPDRTTRVLDRIQRVAPRGGQLLRRIVRPPVAVLNGWRRAASSVGLRLVQRTWSTTTYEAQSADPQLVFHVKRLPTDKVHELRFRLRRPEAGAAVAQLYWAPPGQGFSEERSAAVVLDAPAGQWREYTMRLDAADVAPHWRCGTVEHLRFDPLNRPGVLELGPLELR